MQPQRLIAIGDIHGCVHALDALLEAIEPQATDTIVTLGDVIDYGRESAEVLDRLIELKQQCKYIHLLGNHEEMLLGALEDEEAKGDWLNFGGIDTLNSYRFCGSISDIPLEHIEFLRESPLWFESDDHLLVHANYDAELAFDQTHRYQLLWPLLQPENSRPHISGKTIVCGHTEQRDGEILNLGHLICIDTWCRGFGWLSAIDLLSGQVWQATRFGVLREDETPEVLEQAQSLLHGGLTDSKS